MSKELKPFDKILGRSTDKDRWEADFFSRVFPKAGGKTTNLTTSGFLYEQVIPYEGNEHLLGTKDSPKLKFKWGDKVEVSNYEGDENWTKAIFIKTSTLNNYMVIKEGRIAPIEFRYCRHANW